MTAYKPLQLQFPFTIFNCGQCTKVGGLIKSYFKATEVWRFDHENGTIAYI